MIPTTLDGWTLPAIRALLRGGVQESEAFDWKERLPHKNDDDSKFGLRKDCAAFANSAGGFLIFGIVDQKAGLPPEERLVGLDPSLDFNPQFGSYLSAVRPTVRCEHRQEAIVLPKGHVIRVVRIEATRGAGPHAVDTPKGGGLVFPRRTNAGTSAMSYEEIRLAFSGYHERLRSLHLLHLELVDIRRTTEQVRSRPSHVSHPRVEVALDVFERVLGDSYLLLAEVPGLLDDLQEVRREARAFNSQRQSLVRVLDTPKHANSKYDEDMAERASQNSAHELFMKTQIALAKLATLLPRPR